MNDHEDDYNIFYTNIKYAKNTRKTKKSLSLQKSEQFSNSPSPPNKSPFS